jgi:hypothetical protein
VDPILTTVSAVAMDSATHVRTGRVVVVGAVVRVVVVEATGSPTVTTGSARRAEQADAMRPTTATREIFRNTTEA